MEFNGRVIAVGVCFAGGKVSTLGGLPGFYGRVPDLRPWCSPIIK